MLLDEIREIGEIIAPKLYGKSYRELAFAENMGGIEKSELFHVCATAQTIRLEAMKTAAWSYGSKRTKYGWPEILEICSRNH